MARTRRPNAGVTIGRVRRSDIKAIAALLTELSGRPVSVRAAANRIALVAADSEQTLLVARAAGEVVGLLAFRIRHNIESVSHYGEVSAVVVRSDWRKTGVGRALMERAERLARRRRCLGLWLVSGFGRERKAHKFYERYGFECTGFRFVKPFDDDMR